MAIVKRDEMERALVLDLAGPDGNAFVLLGHARNLAKQLGLDHKKISDEMTSGNYDNLVNVFDSYFGEYVTLIKG